MKRIFSTILLFSVAVFMLASCGGGTPGGGNSLPGGPIDVITGDTGTNSGGGGGGGGGGAGACVVAGPTCINNVDSTTCANMVGTLNSGVSCQSLGYTTCYTAYGYEYCI